METGEIFPMSHILQPAKREDVLDRGRLTGTPRCVMLVESAVLTRSSTLPGRTASTQGAGSCPDALHGVSQVRLRVRRSRLRKAHVAPGDSPGRQRAALRQSVAERLIEQVGLLKAHALERSAGYFTSRVFHHSSRPLRGPKPTWLPSAGRIDGCP